MRTSQRPRFEHSSLIQRLPTQDLLPELLVETFRSRHLIKIGTRIDYTLQRGSNPTWLVGLVAMQDNTICFQHRAYEIRSKRHSSCCYNNSTEILVWNAPFWFIRSTTDNKAPLLSQHCTMLVNVKDVKAHFRFLS